MAFNFGNPYTYPWNSAFTQNAFTAPHPAGGARPPPGFSPDLQMYAGGNFPGAFPFGMAFQGGESNSHFRPPANWNFPYGHGNNVTQYGAIQ